MKYEYQDPPKDDKDGFMNTLKRVANLLEDDNIVEARYAIADIIDTFSPERVLFAYEGGDRIKPMKTKAKVPNPRGTMSDAEWSRIVD